MMKAHLLKGIGPEYVACHATSKPCRYGEADHKKFKDGNALAQYNAVAELEHDGGLAPEQGSPLVGAWAEVRAGHGVDEAQYEALLEKLNDDVNQAKRERADRLRGRTPTTSLDHDADLGTAKGRLARSLAGFLREPSREGITGLKTGMYEVLMQQKMSTVSRGMAEASDEFAAVTKRFGDAVRGGDTDGVGVYVERMNRYRQLMGQYAKYRDRVEAETVARSRELLPTDEPPFDNMNSAKAAGRMVATYIDGPTGRDEDALALSARRAAREYLATDEAQDALRDMQRRYEETEAERYDEETGEWNDDDGIGEEAHARACAIEDFLYPTAVDGYEPDWGTLREAVRPDGPTDGRTTMDALYDNICIISEPSRSLDGTEAASYFMNERYRGNDHGYSEDEYNAIQTNMYHYTPGGKLQTPNGDEQDIILNFRAIRTLTH